MNEVQKIRDWWTAATDAQKTKHSGTGVLLAEIDRLEKPGNDRIERIQNRANGGDKCECPICRGDQL